MRQLRIAIVAFAVAVACQAVATAALAAAFRTVVLDVKAPIAIPWASGAGRIGGLFPSTVSLTCLSFRNTDSRTANHVRFRFVYYDKTGARVGGDVFDQRGTFSTGALVEGFNRRTSTVNLENCAPIHFPHEGIAVNLVYVDSVDFDDGSTWTATVVPLPGQLVHHPTATGTPQPAAQPLAKPSSTPEPDDTFTGG